MESKRQFYIDDKEVIPPSNWQELSIKIDFDGEFQNSIVTTKTRVFEGWQQGTSLGNPVDAINSWMDSGFIYDGLPYRETITDGVTPLVILEGLIDCTTANPIACDSITVDVIEEKTEWFLENAQFTFDFLFEKTDYKNHPNFKFYPVPYAISKRETDKIVLALVASVSIFFQVIDLVDNLIDKITNSAAFEWGEWLASIVFFARALLLTLASIQMLIILYQTLIQPVKYHLTMKVSDLMIVGFAYLGYEFKSSILLDDPQWNKVVVLDRKYQVPRQKNDNNKIYLEALGINLDVLRSFTDANTLMQDEKGYPTDNFNEFVEKWKGITNGLLFFDGDVVRLERRDYAPSTNLYTLPDVEVREHTTNANDINSNTYITFQTDLNDENTINQYDGTACTEIITAFNGKDKKNKLLRGRREVSIPYALGKRKTEQDDIEIIIQQLFETVEPLVAQFIFQHNVKLKTLGNGVNKILNIMNTIINAVPGVSNFAVPGTGSFQDMPYINIPKLTTLIGDRTGMLLLENDNVDVPKIFMLEENLSYDNSNPATAASWQQSLAAGLATQLIVGSPLLAVNTAQAGSQVTVFEATGNDASGNRVSFFNTNLLSAQNIFYSFYAIDSFATINGVHNQWKIYNIPNLHFDFCDLPKVLNTKKIKTSTEQDAEIITFEWNEADEVANITYRVNEQHTIGLTSTLQLTNGSIR